ncbi:hypothetical protein A9Y87_11140 [Salmonella enterica subsp. enterica]|nr:hypothetical protein A9Y87_11140 [Salmonella enterica subsp. enterica]
MTIKGQKLVLPSWKFALAQMAISSANWMAMGRHHLAADGSGCELFLSMKARYVFSVSFYC